MGAHRRIGSAFAALGAMLPGVGTAAAAVPPTAVGINLSPPRYYNQSRAFANLLIGSSWGSRLPEFKKLGPDDVDADGNLKRLPGNAPMWRMLTQPNASTREATIRCTYDGHGQIGPAKSGGTLRTEQGAFSFRWVNRGYKDSIMMLRVDALDPADPIRNIDCRETTIPSVTRFDPEFVDYVRQFKIVRFMDWQNTNKNTPVTWATRHSRRSLDITDDDGVAIEDMVDLAQEAGTSPWFNMPWNADDDYVRRFAQLVHDTLPRDRTVYVELGNEIWNNAFPASKQALREGQAASLGRDPDQAGALRYAQRSAQVLDIWSRVFADRPAKLVRVLSCQNGANCANVVLGYNGTARHVDALATAPYFGHDFGKNPPVDLDSAFSRLDAALVQTLDRALKAKAVADKFGKRYIAYEAGQHVVLKDLELAAKIQTDPRMYDLYRKYFGIWRERIGDTVMMFASVKPIAKSGAWGLQEYLGQPLKDAPKMRAVSEVLQQTNKR